MADDQNTQHTTHVAWLRAALRDQLGVSDEGGTVTLDADQLDELAATAVREMLNWIVAAGKNGLVNISAEGASTDDPESPA